MRPALDSWATRRITARTWIGGVVIVFAVALAAGCSDSVKKGAPARDATAVHNEGRAFPVLRVTWGSPDYLDPGLAYTSYAWMLLQHVNLGLIGYRWTTGAEGATVVPALAERLPAVSSHGTDYRFTLRPNLRYSDGTPLSASDFKASIERLFKIDSPGVGFFMQIVGAPRFAKAKDGPLPGIVVDDEKRTIEIKLSAPRADFLDILGIPFAAVLPASTPPSDQSTQAIPATGPYMVQSYRPKRNVVLLRNPHYEAVPGIPRGNPDRLVATIVNEPAAALETVLRGSSDFMMGVPPDRLAEVQRKHADRLKLYTPASTYYFALNNRLPPFDNLKARQAVNYAIDRRALVQANGGLGIATQNVLPPTYPQYRKIDFYRHDVGRAKRLVAESGTSGMKVTVWGINQSPAREATEYLADLLNKVGWKATPKLLGVAVFFQTVGNQATRAQVVWLNWYQDYPHPLDWFDGPFNGNRITRVHNTNMGNVNFSDVNAAIERLRGAERSTADTDEAWARVDHDLIVEHAALVPYMNAEGADFLGARIDPACYYNHVLFLFDWAAICVKR